MVSLGKRNLLQVVRETSSGIFLDADNLGEILLPGKHAPRDLRQYDVVDVFIYRDSEDRLVCTTDSPHAMVGEFACLRVSDVHARLGAFLDWGLAKDLLLPYSAQTAPVELGQLVPVVVRVDPVTDRIVASARIYDFLGTEPPRFQDGEAVQLLIVGKTPLGFNAIVNNSHIGLLYQTDLASPLEIGARMPGFVRRVREDGKLDLGIDAVGYERIAPLTERIMQALAAAGGRLSLDDDSSPELVRETFGVSKRVFKQALGLLYRERRIVFLHPGIEAMP
ncbi:MAG: GntR family transcriptional regulator [Phycisphaerales bacterium]|nr:GntR family transcriptional regulator [Phycisphaerales bacterium]